MFGFLKRASGMVNAYATGKVYEQWYKIAEVATMQYVQKLWDSNDPNNRNYSLCLWSYLLCTEPRSPELLAFSEQHTIEIEREALQFLELDEPFREVIISTLWVALGICRGQDNKSGFEKILHSEIFTKYCKTYPMLPHDKYAALVEVWARTYSPPHSAASDGE